MLHHLIESMYEDINRLRNKGIYTDYLNVNFISTLTPTMHPIRQLTCNSIVSCLQEHRADNTVLWPHVEKYNNHVIMQSCTEWRR